MPRKVIFRLEIEVHMQLLAVVSVSLVMAQAVTFFSCHTAVLDTQSEPPHCGRELVCVPHHHITHHLQTPHAYITSYEFRIQWRQLLPHITPSAVFDPVNIICVLTETPPVRVLIPILTALSFHDCPNIRYISSLGISSLALTSS